MIDPSDQRQALATSSRFRGVGSSPRVRRQDRARPVSRTREGRERQPQGPRTRTAYDSDPLRRIQLATSQSARAVAHQSADERAHERFLRPPPMTAGCVPALHVAMRNALNSGDKRTSPRPHSRPLRRSSGGWAACRRELRRNLARRIATDRHDRSRQPRPRRAPRPSRGFSPSPSGLSSRIGAPPRGSPRHGGRCRRGSRSRASSRPCPRRTARGTSASSR